MFFSKYKKTFSFLKKNFVFTVKSNTNGESFKNQLKSLRYTTKSTFKDIQKLVRISNTALFIYVCKLKHRFY